MTLDQNEYPFKPQEKQSDVLALQFELETYIDGVNISYQNFVPFKRMMLDIIDMLNREALRLDQQAMVLEEEYKHLSLLASKNYTLSSNT